MLGMTSLDANLAVLAIRQLKDALVGLVSRSVASGSSSIQANESSTGTLPLVISRPPHGVAVPGTGKLSLLRRAHRCYSGQRSLRKCCYSRLSSSGN
ncbi:hypothetical protein HBI56_029190 [Parastagonospora nodorum]|nr:hypothetical protein HBH49_018470 [Parastagonospora nodorum]KAH4203860.1 hypothetical protein HBH42_006670 [Parastagonospora nodorum]KAH4265171.1 hypothetical protein HBI03_079570 [Parastagonospora nodorum]KAH4283052.1 hypothetical protein HBI04_017960 [Parastagonospora nodorum]KAH4312483.1 hypothetical protein HBI01_006660 [Parastagonospora nodorum]